MPEHWLNLYQRPVQGTNFIKRFRTYRYKHKISAVGGYDTASCLLAVTPNEAQRFLDDYLGCRVHIYVDNPIEPIWEGFINRVMLTMGSAMYTISLDAMFNRVTVVYTAPTVTANAPQQTTTPVDNTESQAVFGVKEGQIEGTVFMGTDVTRITTLQSTLVAVHSWPQKSTTFGSGRSGEMLLQVDLLGWYHALGWARYYAPGSGLGSRTPTQFFTELLPDYPNPSFFSTSDFSLISSNTSWVGNRQMPSSRTYLQQFQSVQETGDGIQQWVFGIAPADLATGVRRVYYQPANTEIEYTLKARDGIVRNIYGKPIPPWHVRPDRGARISDVLTFWDGMGDDPREFYVESVDYDAETQTVQLVSDDLTPEGVFQLKRYYKAVGTRFGPFARQGWP